MKLSVCIPVYNFDIRELVYDLWKEITEKNLDAEIILIDDASDEKFNILNREIQNKISDFIFLEKNIGRSAIRNLFLNYSKGDYLLFLDCDAKLIHTNFLNDYLQEIQNNNGVEVVYGSFRIDPKYSHTLRNKYSVEREIFYGERSSDFSVFKTVNFIIRRDTFKQFSFNEELLHYGYEDYIFAKKLELNKVRFLAIQNPVIHIDDTPNIIFLAKTEIAIDSLIQLSRNPGNAIFIHNIKVYKMAQKLIKTSLRTLFLVIFKLVQKKIIGNLLSESPSIKYLDFYKLGLLLKKSKG